jgi:hypothetical protein
MRPVIVNQSPPTTQERQEENFEKARPATKDKNFLRRKRLALLAFPPSIS